MLNLSRDTTSDVKLGANSHASLTNLSLMLNEAGVDSGTACAHFTAKHIGKLKEHVEVLLAAHAVAASHDNGCVLDINF